MNNTYPYASLNPDYVPPKTKHYCSICSHGILNGEDYVENYDGELAHWDCISSYKQLLEWFGQKIMIMEDE